MKKIMFVVALVAVVAGFAKAEPKIRYLEKAVYEKVAEFGVASNSTGTLTFKNTVNNNSVNIESGVTSSTYTLILPTTIGNDGQILAINSVGQLYFTDDSTGTSTTLTQEEVEDYVGAMLDGNTETDITVTYQDGDGTIDFVIDSTITRDTEWDSLLKIEAVVGYDVITSTEIDSETELETLIGESVWTDGENITPADVDSTGDIKVNQDKKIILNDDDGADSYIVNNASDDSTSFFSGGVEIFRIEQ